MNVIDILHILTFTFSQIVVTALNEERLDSELKERRG